MKIKKCFIETFVIGFLIFSCGKLDHTNPYDPKSPLNLQARGSISGKVVLEESQTNEGILVSLKGTSLTTLTDMDGNWKLTDVPAGPYIIVFSKEGWEYLEAREITLGIGYISG